MKLEKDITMNGKLYRKGESAPMWFIYPFFLVHMGMFGLSGDKVFQESGTLSGGEKTKLALAMLMTGKNNMLLLDEPTNNLDPPSREAVANALVDWPGAIIFVSHDTEFVHELAPTKVLLMPDDDVDYFSEDWLDLVAMA